VFALRPLTKGIPPKLAYWHGRSGASRGSRFRTTGRISGKTWLSRSIPSNLAPKRESALAGHRPLRDYDRASKQFLEWKVQLSAEDLLKKFRSGTYTDRNKIDFKLSDISAAERHVTQSRDRFDLVRLRGWYHYLRQDFQAAMAAQLEAFALRPDLEGIKNIGILARNLKDRSHAIDFLLRFEAEFQNAFEFYDVLAHNCGIFGDPAAAARFGTRSLQLKHEHYGKISAPAKLAPPPPFQPRPERNIIAFSLFGANPRYAQPLLVSADLRPHFYPLWTIRIYVDESVPGDIVKKFEAKGCQIVRVTDVEWPGTFWRFLAADDPQIDRFLIRDADSILNIRERVAVDAWIASRRHFHVMRDFCSHSELILAGLWGGVRGALPPIGKLIEVWLSERKTTVYNQTTSDQLFLREKIWQLVRQSVLVHDSIFGFGDKVDFPAVGTLPPGKHVGQDDYIFFKRGIGGTTRSAQGTSS
jgi:hypothetical protein